MEGTAGILKRFIGATVIISIFLLIFNFVLVSIWIKGANEGQSPTAVVQSVAKSLHRSSDTYSLDSLPAKLLMQKHAWAMLINDEGRIAWSYMLPNELNKKYLLSDVAKFTRNYLSDYPVFVWENDDGLIVVGYPKVSLAKYQYILSTSWVSSLPLKLFFLLIGNITLALILSILIGTKLIHAIRPLTQAIQTLAEDKDVFLQPKGILANLAQSVNRTSDLLRQKDDLLKNRDEARSNWIAGISHDIRTPLSKVLGYASGMEENSMIPEEQRKQAGIIRQQGENLRSLVSDLNLVSMLEYEMQPINKKHIRLSALIRKVASEFLNNELDERFSLEVEISDESLQVNGDERLIIRAITNLIQNSINHNPGGCKIRLQTAFNACNNTCSFIISDNGKGISKNELSYLLELPYSSTRKRPSQNGHGLGLPMTSRIAKAHQGRLILSSDVGKGLKSEIELPCDAKFKYLGNTLV